jgi:outer membrane lipoprotein-sorting protein
MKRYLRFLHPAKCGTGCPQIHTRIRFVTAFILLAVFALVYPAAEGATQAPITDGLEVMKKKSEAYMANDQISTVTLRLFTKEGDEKKIATKRYWKNFKGKEGMATKTLFFTEYPPDAKGTGFLIWNYTEAGKPDNLWLYLPSLRQSRQVSSRGQDDAFMGSDLTFGDMGQRRLEEDDHKLLKEEACGAGQCYVVESVAKDKEGVYSKKVLWITKTDFITMKIDYYDRKGELLKTQQINWQDVSGYKAWKSSEVVNVQTRHKTIFEISNLKMNPGLSDDTFTERTLKTGVRQ